MGHWDPDKNQGWQGEQIWFTRSEEKVISERRFTSGGIDAVVTLTESVRVDTNRQTGEERRGSPSKDLTIRLPQHIGSTRALVPDGNNSYRVTCNPDKESDRLLASVLVAMGAQETQGRYGNRIFTIVPKNKEES